MQTEASDLQAAYRRTALIGGAMVASLFLYAVVAFAIASMNDPFEGFASFSNRAFLRNFFLGVSLLQIVSIHTIRSRTLRAPDPTGQSQASTSSKEKQLISRLVAMSMVTFALAEFIGICGLVLFLLNGGTSDFLIFLGLSLLTFVMFFPKYPQWDEWLQKHHQLG